MNEITNKYKMTSLFFCFVLFWNIRIVVVVVLPCKLGHDVGELLVEIPVGVSLVELKKEDSVEVSLSGNLLVESDHPIHVAVKKGGKDGGDVLDSLIGVDLTEHLDVNLDILLTLLIIKR